MEQTRQTSMSLGLWGGEGRREYRGWDVASEHGSAENGGEGQDRQDDIRGIGTDSFYPNPGKAHPCAHRRPYQDDPIYAPYMRPYPPTSPP